MKKSIIVSMSAVAAFLGISAQATTITFDDQGFANLDAVTTQYAPQGVTFAGITDSGATVNLDVSDSTTYGDINPYSAPFSLANFYNGDPLSRANVMQMLFTAPVSGVGFYYNPAGSSGSSTVFNAYNAAHTLIGSFSDPSATTDDGNWYLESFGSLTGIAEVDIVSPSSGWGHYIDNLSFTPGTGVPDGGSSLALLGLALSGLTLIRRKLS